MPSNGWEGAPCLSSRAAPDEQRPHLIPHRRCWSFSHIGFELEEDGDDGDEDGQLRHDCRQRRQVIEEEEEEEQRREGVPGFGRWSTFSYCRLPQQQQLRLTIVKLDGSSFDVHVTRSASVSELRLAVEELFTRSPNEEGNISWSHVWGHFCLSYNSHKLVDDKTSLRTLGIKDGDVLHFVRHLSVNYNPVEHVLERI